jgi:DnaJ-class molecular chaperone
MKKLNHFAGVKNIEELKKAYKTLVKKYHPDLNKEIDTTKIMQEINNEYDIAFEIFKNIHAEENKAHTEKTNDAFKNIVDVLVKFDESIVVEIVGSWIWVYGGNTFHVKEQLKEIHFQWSSKHKKWYYAGTEIEFKKKGYKNNKSYDEIKDKYGSQRIATTKRDKLA